MTHGMCKHILAILTIQFIENTNQISLVIKKQGMCKIYKGVLLIQVGEDTMQTSLWFIWFLCPMFCKWLLWLAPVTWARNISWQKCNNLDRHLPFSAGVRFTKTNSSFPSFSRFFWITKILAIYWISRSYLTGVTAAKLQWHLSNMNEIQRI